MIFHQLLRCHVFTERAYVHDHPRFGRGALQNLPAPLVLLGIGLLALKRRQG